MKKILITNTILFISFLTFVLSALNYWVIDRDYNMFGYPIEQHSDLLVFLYNNQLLASYWNIVPGILSVFFLMPQFLIYQFAPENFIIAVYIWWSLLVSIALVVYPVSTINKMKKKSLSKKLLLWFITTSLTLILACTISWGLWELRFRFISLFTGESKEATDIITTWVYNFFAFLGFAFSTAVIGMNLIKTIKSKAKHPPHTKK